MIQPSVERVRCDETIETFRNGHSNSFEMENGEGNAFLPEASRQACVSLCWASTHFCAMLDAIKGPASSNICFKQLDCNFE